MDLHLPFRLNHQCRLSHRLSVAGETIGGGGRVLRTVYDSDPPMPQVDQVLGSHLPARYVVYVHERCAVGSLAKESNAGEFLADQLRDYRVVFVAEDEDTIHSAVS